MPLDPIQMTNVITDSYLSYLSTTFYLRDSALRKQFEKELRQPDRLIKGPILEATPPFEPGSTLESLIQAGILSPRFRWLRTDRLPMERPLYRHQEEAIRKLVVERRNVVVTTGTGSGKTETFLVPILNHLFEEERDGQLGPGVRALLLYPMNALANDQMVRLRELLAHYPTITFGRYTGETEERTQPAVEKHRLMFHSEPLANERVSREQMREAPPHLLLTNYAMLEYLLLRPDDNVFFDGPHAQFWHFLVLDEAHTYSGAKGIEMAMLLRRLKDRVVDGEKGRLQCIATSATLGKGEQDFPAVVQFAQQLFGEAFTWNAGDPNQQDVIQATRLRLSTGHSREWRPDPSLYVRWQAQIAEERDTLLGELIEAGIEAGLPESALRRLAEAEMGQPWQRFLYKVLSRDASLSHLRQRLEEGPGYVATLASELFGKSADARRQLIALVDLAARAKPGPHDLPLLPARYHLFVRAVEGVYLTLRPKPQIFLERREYAEIEGRRVKVFEGATCRQCGATYLVGEREEVNGQYVFKQPGTKYYESASNLHFYLVLNGTIQRTEVDEDELALYSDEDEIHESYFKLCAACGAIDRADLLSPLCRCDQANTVTVMEVSSKEGSVHICPACGSRSPLNLVWRFLTGNDATASVLATAVYQELPPPSKNQQAQTEVEPEDDWSSTAPSDSSMIAPDGTDTAGRQLLVFSDSRQAAAFFAPYLNRTYSQILRRRLILKTLEENREKVLTNRWRVQDLVTPLQSSASRAGLFTGMSPQEQETEVWKWLLYELLALDRRNSLEGLGCLGFALVKPERWRAPKPLLQWELSEEEVWTLFQILLDSFRTKGAIHFPDIVAPDDGFFAPRNREIFFCAKLPQGKRSNAYRNVMGWEPTRPGALNARTDFLMRLHKQGLGRDLDNNTAQIILRQIWQKSLAFGDTTSCWSNHVSAFMLDGGDVAYRIKPTVWELRPGLVDPSLKWYRCDTCHNLTSLNLRNICPTYQCNGTLRECDPAIEFRDNHYRRLYAEIKPIKMDAQEHTAQLTSEAAADLQMRFMTGEVNVLSCSTTFEMGVDVGELEAVFMRNVPPSAANYVQRAGRAGRRASSTAFALTFAQRRSHDLTHFRDPLRMVSGEIKAPYFEIANEKIVRRHVYATALAAFWKQQPETFGNVDIFFFQSAPNGIEQLREFLAQRRTSLQHSLQRIVPNELHQTLDIDGWGWVPGLLDEEEGVLTKAGERVITDVKQLMEARDRLIQQNRPSDYILRVARTMREKDIISYFSSQNVIPKYGFPVDVVSLQILHHAEEAKRLELDRDLRIALSEYAPSSQVVAGGKLWTSRYLKRLPDRGWVRYNYAVCDRCRRYQRSLADTGTRLTVCQSCGEPLSGRNQGTFIVPEFGFMTAVKAPEKPGETQPERTYSTRTYFSGEAKDGARLELTFGDITLTSIPASEGRLAVINHAGYRGFKVCHSCGFTLLGDENYKGPHKTPWQSECNGTLRRTFLGHEFHTDILQLRIDGCTNTDHGFWLSLLYALLEGSSEALDIDRQDLDGCLYAYAGNPYCPAIVLFDDVPGGAGHVHRIGQTEQTLRSVLQCALEKLSRCECGGTEGDTSCYGCLRTYRNQWCHDELQRGPVIDFLRRLMDL